MKRSRSLRLKKECPPPATMPGWRARPRRLCRKIALTQR